MNCRTLALPSVAGLLALIATVAAADDVPIVFEDVTARAGLARHLEPKDRRTPWRYGHGAGWGDVDGDGRPDLYAGAFAGRDYFRGENRPVPNMLFLNRPGGFELAEDKGLQFLNRNARCAGVLFADLDNDGDLDLVVSNHVQASEHVGSRLFENLGKGQFKDVTADGAPWPHRIGARNITAIDLNGDGLLDLIFADGSYGKKTQSNARLVVLENRGGFSFADAAAKVGLDVAGTFGLGLAVGDVNQDCVPDIFVAGSNRLFVSDGKGRYREAHRERFAIQPADVQEGVHCGAAFADLNGDDLLDLVTTEHGAPTRIHVFVNRGVRDGLPDFIEVSETAGVGQIFPRGAKERLIKTNHVALQDVDNDGRPDILLAMLFRDHRDQVQPLVLRNLSARSTELKFAPPPFDRLVGVYTPAPAADFDRDGRMDVFFPSWNETLPNYLFRNMTAGGNWLSVRVDGRTQGRNAIGIGAVVRIYASGHAGDPKHLLGRRDIVVGTGYASTEEAIAHFGLGETRACDLEISWGDKQVTRNGTAANQLLLVLFDP